MKESLDNELDICHYVTKESLLVNFSKHVRSYTETCIYFSMNKEGESSIRPNKHKDTKILSRKQKDKSFTKKLYPFNSYKMYPIHPLHIFLQPNNPQLSSN